LTAGAVLWLATFGFGGSSVLLQPASSARPLKHIDITQKLFGEFAETEEDDYFPFRCRKDLFFEMPLQGRAAFGQTPRPNHHKEENMADMKVPQRLDPQNILKLLVALRRALKTRAA